MIPDEELNALKDRISQMSDHHLLQIVEVEYGDYRKEALEFAEAELTKRNIPFEHPETAPYDADDDADEEADDEDGDDQELVSAAVDRRCTECGGSMRLALLFADNELTRLFSDNNEERFVNAYACSACGDVKLSVDLTTEVER